LQLPKYSIGIGDRFAHQGSAQLAALILARRQDISIAPVWNKSYREHSIVGSQPADARAEADHSVQAWGWSEPYFVDADHINLKTVDGFLDFCDFFTLDVADCIGQAADEEALNQFLARHRPLIGSLTIPGIDEPVEITEPMMTAAGRKFLAAVGEAGRIYRHIAQAKKTDPFVVEISMDETDQPQTPVELLMILAAASDEAIPVQTVAPRFSGRFNKGVDYVGEVAQFRREFEQDLAVIAWAVREFGLPANLKLSVHSGSDKFSLYRPIHEALGKFDAGIHLKTAGTTWLEELIGLASAGGDGLEIAKEIYAEALSRYEELCEPYASVIDINRVELPSAESLQAWNGKTFARALRHDSSCPDYNPHLRQLLHVGYKIAAEMGSRFTDALEKHATVITAGVTENLYQRHIRPLLLEE